MIARVSPLCEGFRSFATGKIRGNWLALAGRSGISSTRIAEFESLGVAFISLRDNLEMSTAAGLADASDHRCDGRVRKGADPRNE